MSLQSFLVNLLSFILMIILLGFSFLIIDRLVLQGKYTNPYNKDGVIKSLGERLNLQVQENNLLKNQIINLQNAVSLTQRELNSIPVYQLNGNLQQWLNPNDGITFEKGRLVFREQTFFQPGSEELTSSAKKSLKKIALKLLQLDKENKFPWVLRIEGHTDNQNLPNQDGYKSRWLIGHKRAYAVGQYLISKGVDAKRIYMASFSSYRQGVYPNNQRVSLSFDYA